MFFLLLLLPHCPIIEVANSEILKPVVAPLLDIVDDSFVLVSLEGRLVHLIDTLKEKLASERFKSRVEFEVV